MAEAIKVICMDCRKALWIGQARHGFENAYLYGGDEAAAFVSFIGDHLGHHVIFADDQTAEALPDEVRESIQEIK
jgi:hypothetical protein